MDGDGHETVAPFSERFGAFIFGLFLLAFGMPFTFVPVLIFGDSSIDIFSFPGLFVGLFCTPFVIAGLSVQYLGISMIRLGLNPNDENAMKGVGRVLGDTKSESTEKNPLPRRQSDIIAPAETTTDRVENFWDSVEIDSN